MNNDLISRKYVVKELLKELKQYPPMVAERYSFGVKVPHSFNQAMRGGIRKALRIAETALAVDAEVVRHGEWLILDYSPAWTKCSECGSCWEWGMIQDCNISYCPNCGAKMRGDEDAQ